MTQVITILLPYLTDHLVIRSVFPKLRNPFITFTADLTDRKYVAFNGQHLCCMIGKFIYHIEGDHMEHDSKTIKLQAPKFTRLCPSLFQKLRKDKLEINQLIRDLYEDGYDEACWCLLKKCKINDLILYCRYGNLEMIMMAFVGCQQPDSIDIYKMMIEAAGNPNVDVFCYLQRMFPEGRNFCGYETVDMMFSYGNISLLLHLENKIDFDTYYSQINNNVLALTMINNGYLKIDALLEMKHKTSYDIMEKIIEIIRLHWDKIDAKMMLIL